MLRTLALVICLIIPGVAVAGVCGYFALVDYTQLQDAYSHFHSVVGSGASTGVVFAAYAGQDIHRINLFAEGVWAMLGFILAGLGVLGLCIGARRK